VTQLYTTVVSALKKSNMSSDEMKALIGRIGRKQIKIVEFIERSWGKYPET